MAVAPTGALFKALTFDGESSRDYGLYITGAGVYNAPEREVEMVTIPGRNGAFALDRGRFENITITYPAGLYADTPEDFADAISEARNWLTSKRGYVRLSDEYNPDEYRLAVYKSGLEVDPATLAAGEFDLEFEAMPQRWLTSGETAQAVASGGTITNPTRFASRPLLEVNGYGAIEINGETVSINAGPLGNVNVMNVQSTSSGVSVESLGSQSFTFSAEMDTAQLNTGDDIAVSYSVSARLDSPNATHDLDMTRAGVTKTSGDMIPSGSAGVAGGWATVDIVGSSLHQTAETFQKGTARTASGVYRIGITYTSSTSGLLNVIADMAVSLAYDGAEGLTLSITITSVMNALLGRIAQVLGSAIGDSTKSALGEPAYIDLDTGEAYKLEGGAVVGINNGVTLPGELPELEPGANSISYDSTITALSIVPRWWKV